ncbi:MAG: transposase, partial [Myxococcaceae bacterium]|nr:transposase [Myxococcaceae bacterium]
TYLVAFLDDATRVVPFAAFALSENTAAFLPVLKLAIMRRGVPKRLFVDNGAAYRSHHLALVCAKLGITLIHARPFAPQSKGKQERWFRTVRMQLLTRLTEGDTSSLETLNRKLWAYVEGEYHQAPHRGLDEETPLDRWAKRADEVKYLDGKVDLDDFFLTEARRKVAKDRTVSLAGLVYEVDASLVGETVTLRYEAGPAQSRTVQVWHDGAKVFVLMPRRETVVGQESVPKMTALRIDEVVWSSSEMDVAVLAGVDVAPMETGSEFIDGSSHADVATTIRSRWRRASSETTSLPFFVLGFPDFGHLVDEDRRIETLTSVPLPGYVTQLEEHAWRGDGAVPPQLLLEVDAHEPSPANNEHDRAGLLRRRLFDPSQDSPFGGYSGGPVAVAGSDGLYLIGVVKEGVHLFGQFRVVGTPWDDVVAALRRSAEWQRFCAASR